MFRSRLVPSPSCLFVRQGCQPTTSGTRALLATFCAMLAFSLGCEKEEKPIEHYQVAVPSERPALPAGHGEVSGHGETAAANATGMAAENTRMLAALISQGEQTWFFKVTGPADVVDPFADTFRDFIRSVRFPKDAPHQPTWTLPEGWRQDPAKGMRYATVRFGPQDGPLAMSVIPLQTAGDAETYTLMNINRWRSQLGLPPITAEQLDAETESIELPEGKATMVRFLGTFRSDAMRPSRGPMTVPPSGGQPAAEPGKLSDAPSKPAKGPTLTYDAPKTWTPGKVGGMRKAAFQVTDGEKQAEVTVIDLAAAAGDLLPNVNRWRGQIELGAMTQAEMDAELSPMAIDGRAGNYVRLVGPESAKPREAILGVILVDGGQSWFFKMKGSAELVERERDNFESFVRSIKFATQ
ncbi:MAG: hypothetical protein ACC645_00600 [Pirellulales bacterium]